MSRPIKFRAWDTKVGEMVYDVGIKDDMVCWKNSMDELIWRSVETWVPMQSTGLFDKNGVEIFEGDRLKYVSSRCLECGAEHTHQGHKPYTVRWTERCASFTASNLDNWIDAQCWGTDMEIIGNIHEHPELLGKK